MNPDEILMKEYAGMREEVLLHFRNAKLHLKYSQAFIAVAAAAAWYVFFGPGHASTSIVEPLKLKQ